MVKENGCQVVLPLSSLSAQASGVSLLLRGSRSSRLAPCPSAQEGQRPPS